MHVYYINLDHRKDRKQKIERYLKNLPVTFSRVPGVFLDINELFETGGKYNYLLEKVAKKNFLNHKKYRQRVRGFIGCYLSHVKTYELALEEQQENYLILEDDVSISSLQEFKTQIDFLQNKPWDIYRSIWNFQRVDKIIAGQMKSPTLIKNNHKLSVYNNHTSTNNSCFGGSHFTYVNNNSTKKILTYLKSENIFGLDGILSTSEINVYVSSLRSLKVGRPGSKDIPKTK